MALSTACPKGETRYQYKAEKVAAVVANERDVYKAVNARDGRFCRVCRAWIDHNGIGLLNRSHHHHLQYRSAGGPTTTANICLLCARCHDQEHRHELRLGGDADLRDAMGRLSGLIVERLTDAGWVIEKVS